MQLVDKYAHALITYNHAHMIWCKWVSRGEPGVPVHAGLADSGREPGAVGGLVLQTATSRAISSSRTPPRQERKQMLGKGRLLLFEADASPSAATRTPLVPEAAHSQAIIPPTLLEGMLFSVRPERPVLEVPKAGRS